MPSCPYLKFLTFQITRSSITLIVFFYQRKWLRQAAVLPSWTPPSPRRQEQAHAKPRCKVKHKNDNHQRKSEKLHIFLFNTGKKVAENTKFRQTPRLLTKSLETPLYRGGFRGEVCARHLTCTSLTPQLCLSCGGFAIRHNRI